MSNGTKRTLAELITLHELEPELSEVITEGRVDAAVILWFLRRQGSDATIYCVSDRLDVPATAVRSQGQNVSNKGRVISAALKVGEESPEATRKLTFVYDIDDDVMAGRTLAESECLLHTDYRSIELYCFAKNPIDKLLKITLRAPDDLGSGEVLAAITNSLVDIAYARFTLSRIEDPVAMIAGIERRCRVEGDAVIVDVDSLISDSIDKVGGERARGVTKADLMTNYARERTNSVHDVRLVIRGHDFTRICCYYLKTRYPRIFREDRLPYKTPEVFEGALITCLESGELASEQLFHRLLQRHCSSSEGS